MSDVQVLQTVALGQGGHIGDMTAPGDLQELQLLAVGQRGQILDGAAGENGNLKVGHIGAEADVDHVGVVTQVDILGVGAVLQEIAVAVLDAVDRADHLGICQPAAVLVVLEHTPDDLDMGIIIPDAGHGLVAQAAVIQQEVGAVDQLVQGVTDLSLALVADVHLHKFDPLVRRGNGLTKQLELINEIELDAFRHRLLQLLHIRQLQIALAVSGHQVHLLQVGQQTQLGGIGIHLLRGDGADVQLGGILAQLHAVEADGAGNLHIRVSQLQRIHLDHIQPGGRQLHRLQSGQILQIGQQLGVIIVALNQGDLGRGAADGGIAHRHIVDHFDLGMGLGISQDLLVAGAAGQIHLSQAGIFLQLGDAFGIHHHGQFLDILGILASRKHQQQAGQRSDDDECFFHRFASIGDFFIIIVHPILIKCNCQELLQTHEQPRR